MMFGMKQGRSWQLPNSDLTAAELPLEVLRFLALASISLEALELSRQLALKESKDARAAGPTSLFLLATSEGDRGSGYVRLHVDGYQPFNGGGLRGLQGIVNRFKMKEEA